LILVGIGIVVPFVVIFLVLFIGNLFGVYAIVNECEAKVFVLFGKVIGVIDKPGLHFLWGAIGPGALIVNILGKTHKVDLRLDQQYIRKNPVNSSEGSPMNVGFWLELRITNPQAYLFRNSNPLASLLANVSNATVRSLSNLPLETLLQDRHTLSREIRKEVTGITQDFGYAIGSTYIRKVDFRDANMLAEIQTKVVNRLRQVTRAILQKGANEVSVIRSTADKAAAVKFGQAAAIRPRIVGEMWAQISGDPEVNEAMLEVLENKRLMDNATPLVIVDPNVSVIVADKALSTESS